MAEAIVNLEEAVYRLKDGVELLIRPLREEDAERSHAFFMALSEEDRRYLRVDVTRRETVEKRIRRMDPDRIRRLVAIAEGEIVADGSLEVVGSGWDWGEGEIRLIVARPYRRKGLGMLLARELYTRAASLKVQQLVVRMLRPQKAARHIFRRLGFRRESVIPEAGRDRSGQIQDIIEMRCNMEGMWQELESFFATSDWERSR